MCPRKIRRTSSLEHNFCEGFKFSRHMTRQIFVPMEFVIRRNDQYGSESNLFSMRIMIGNGLAKHMCGWNARSNNNFKIPTRHTTLISYNRWLLTEIQNVCVVIICLFLYETVQIFYNYYVVFSCRLL